jgi:hypothetical protein
MFAQPLVWGLGLGWLAGYAGTPTATTLITSLLGIFTGASALAAAKQRVEIGAKTIKLDLERAGPITAAIVGLVAGFTCGVCVRCHCPSFKPC